MCNLAMFHDEGKLDTVENVIKNVNFLNRLLLQSDKGYVLGQKRVIDEPEKVETQDFQC